MYAIRKATALDTGNIALLHVQTWREAYRGLIPDLVLADLSVNRRARYWRGLLDSERDDGNTVVFVATHDDTVVGFASIGPCRVSRFSTRLSELSTLYVDAEHWRHGIGTRLLDEAIEDAERKRPQADTILWVLDGNTRAQRFYTKHGFVADGARKAIDWGTVVPSANNIERRMRRASRAINSAPSVIDSR